MPLEGQQIDRYRIVRLLGSGGMGEVYLAEDARIEQQVALKVIRVEVSSYPDTAVSQEAVRLFQNEARAIAKLDHPHILPLYDYGEQRLGNTTLIYLVMPYRREGSLADWLRRRGKTGLLSPVQVAHLIRQAASALQHAHSRQIIHQDVKPANFLMHYNEEDPARPDVLLADFGVARFTSAASSMNHSIRGTPTYMAPEQWSGEPVPATDQYALAIMAYELLAGSPPFQGPPMRLMHLHALMLPPPPSAFNPRLSDELDAVLLHALEKRPEQRFASMSAFATAFQQAAQSMSGGRSISGGDAPTYITPIPTPPSVGDIRAALAISTSEAQTGTIRTLTLPGGRQVRVSVPAGVSSGQIVRLEGQGQTFFAGGPTGALILTLLVQAPEEPPSIKPSVGRPDTMTSGTQAEERTVLTPAVQPSSQPPAAFTPQLSQLTSQPSRFPTTPTPQPSQPPAAFTPQPLPPPAPIMAKPPQRSISRRAVVLGLVGMTVIGVASGGFLLAHAQQPAGPPSVGTTLYTYHGHSYYVHAVAWSPNGQRIASGSGDKTVQVWDAVDGSHAYTYRGHADGVLTVAWSPDGQRIASGSSDSTAQVWDAATGGNVYTYRGHSRAVFAVAWSPDGKHIASGGYGDSTVQVWDAATGNNVYTYRGHSSGVNAVEWSPDGKRIASAGNDTTVQVWDATTGNNVYTYRGHANTVWLVAWSPDGQRIASASDDKTVQVWDAANGNNAYTYHGHANGVLAVTWSPDGRHIASGSNDQTVQIWDAASGSPIYTYHGHSDGVLAVAWSPNSKRIASASNDQTVQIWVAE